MPRETREERRKEEAFSEDVKFLLVVLLLFVFYPVGLVLMWAWTKWPAWVKVLISLPVLLGILLFFVGIVFFFGALRSNWMEQNSRPVMMRQYYYNSPNRMYRIQMQQPQSPETPSPTESPDPSATY